MSKIAKKKILESCFAFFKYSGQSVNCKSSVFAVLINDEKDSHYNSIYLIETTLLSETGENHVAARWDSGKTALVSLKLRFVY